MSDELGTSFLFGSEIELEKYSNVPIEQFRLVDFDKVIFDAQHFPVHEVTQVQQD